MELTKENICEYLLHLGFDKCEILSIRNVRNFCAKVSTNKGNILVKQKGSNRSTFADVSMYNELLFYKLITKGVLFTDNQSITPKVLNIDEEFEIVTIDFLDDYKNLSIEDNTENYQLSYELGKQVASIHNVSTELCNGFTIAKTENYFRTFDIVTPEMFNAGGPLFAKCVELMQRYPDLNEGIESFRKEFCWDCLIHGDLKPDNILFKITNEKQYVKFIDWELTGLGDRYLDLGYVVGGYLLWWIENMKFGNDLDVNNERMAIVREHIYYFIMGYQNTLADKFKLDYIKLSHFTSIFLLNIFHSKSFFKSQYSKQDIMILETARKMLINSEIVYRELFMKLIMQSYEKLF